MGRQKVFKASPTRLERVVAALKRGPHTRQQLIMLLGQRTANDSLRQAVQLGIAAKVDGLWRYVPPPIGGCSKCGGSRGGVEGNGNVVDGRVLCDHCHSEHLLAQQPAEAPHGL